MSALPVFPLRLRPVPGRDGWYRTRIGDWEELEARVLALQDSTQFGTWQVICGLLDHENGHRIFVIDAVHPVELARQFGTGSHNAWDTEQVCNELAKVYDIAPFRPYFIDPAGYKCRFVPAISRQQANAIEEFITVGMEPYGDVESLAGTLVANIELRMWWD